jgi:Flp pilus assembly pilin Flp
MKLRQRLSRIWECDQAQDIAEYAVLIAVVLIIVVATATALGTNTHTLLSRATSAFGSVAQPQQ